MRLSDSSSSFFSESLKSMKELSYEYERIMGESATSRGDNPSLDMDPAERKKFERAQALLDFE
jgi:hypothetical protein